jgi:uncharacterized membrane protein
MADLSSRRIEVIDVVRGLVMMLMTLDHTRDYFGNHDISALDLSQTHPALFFSRWITHLCAPTFVFLAGSSIGLMSARKDSRSLAQYLFTRGLILILFEQTVLRCFGWYFNFDYHYMSGNVLFGIGGAMILMGLCTKVPIAAIRLLALAVIVLHTGIESAVTFAPETAGYTVWTILLQGGNIEFLPGYNFFVSYPLLPWFGILALGYSLYGTFVVDNSSKVWRNWAIGFLGVFVLLRLTNLYGDPAPWQAQSSWWLTVASIINLEKYPPSFLFTLMTLGIAFLLLRGLSGINERFRNILGTLGKTPLFYYAAHIALIHSCAVLLSWIRYGRAEWLYQGPGIFWSETLPGHPPDYGLSLPWVYLITMLAIVILYPMCQWYFRLKQKQTLPWLKYF